MITLIPASRARRCRLILLLVIFAVLAWFNRGQCYFLLTRPPVLYAYVVYQPHEGDVVFQSLPHGELVDAIEGITHSPWSHCGVVLRNKQDQWVVIESIFNVHETPLFLWMLRSRDGNFAAYRLASKFDSLIPPFKANLIAYSGSGYDFDYDMTNKDGNVYCSDLVYLAFDKTSGEKLGALEKLGDMDWQPFKSFIKSEQRGRLPLDRVMITPASLARAPQLHQVIRVGRN